MTSTFRNPPTAKPQRTALQKRTRRERMAAASPPPPGLYDPDMTKFETALKNIRSFEEALFWDDESQVNYSPDPSLYPDTSGSKLWLSDSQSTDHAKRAYINKKLDRLETSKTHTLDINPNASDNINSITHNNPTQGRQNTIKSYLVNQPTQSDYVQIPTNQNILIVNPIDPRQSFNTSNRNITSHPQLRQNKTPTDIPPLAVTFTVNEETNNHIRSTFIPQITRETMPSFISNDPDATNTVGATNTQTHSDTITLPHSPAINTGQPRTPDIQVGNAKQSYYAEILPDALEVWKSFRNASQRVGACRIRAGYMRYLARSGRFPAWTSTMMPPPGMITTMDASLRLVAHRRQQAVSSLNLMASILEDKAINHKSSVDLYKEGLKQQYSDYTPYPGSTIDYNYQTALDVSKSLVDRDHADLNKKLNEDSAILKQGPDNALWSGIEHKFRPRHLSMTQPDNTIPSHIQPQNQPLANHNTVSGNNLTPVSPLMNIEHPSTHLAPNQIFQTAWGQIGRRQNRGANTGRRRPYNQTTNTARPYQDPQNYPYDNQGYNQGYGYQNPTSRRRGHREFPMQNREQQDNRESDLLNMLKRFVEKY